jgi:Amt family ammonium transporter
LTNLCNRSEFEAYLQDAISSQDLHTLLYIDLDQFKVINDTCGHAAGDECLRQISAIFKQHTGSHNMLARLGGDEFGIVFWDQHLAEGKANAERLRQALQANHFQWLQRLFKTTVSIGLVTLDGSIHCGAQALSLADAACYEAKEAGRNRIVINHPDKHTTIYRYSQMDMVTTLTQALKDQQFTLFQQPIIPLFTATQLPHYEILLRLQTDNGVVSPGAFLPAAQRYNLLGQIDRWVFNRTCQWLAEGDNMTQTGRVNINLSPQSLSDPSFLGFVRQCLTIYRLAAQKICLELTEYSAFNNFTQVLHDIHALRDLGFSFALDEFGSGFASFDYINRLPVDIIKIDGQFIHDINHNDDHKTMVQAITKIAHNQGKKIIAEWVEDAATLATLRELGVDYAQGFHLGKPRALYVFGAEPAAIALLCAV